MTATYERTVEMVAQKNEDEVQKRADKAFWMRWAKRHSRSCLLERYDNSPAKWFNAHFKWDGVRWVSKSTDDIETTAAEGGQS
jgi:cytochrome P450